MNITSLLAAEKLYKGVENKLPSESRVQEVLLDLYARDQLHPDGRHLFYSSCAVMAILSNEEMISRFSEYKEKFPGTEIPQDYLREVQAVAADSVSI